MEEYRCDADGLYLLSRVHDGTLSIPGFPDDVDHNETTYTTPPLLRPNVPVLGETWTRRAVGTFTPDGAAAQAIDTTELFVVSQEGVHHTSAFDPAFIHRGANGTEETWIQDVGLARHPSIALLQSHTP